MSDTTIKIYELSNPSDGQKPNPMMKYDNRSVKDTLKYINLGLGFKTSTLYKTGKKGKQTHYWMIEIPKSRPIFCNNLIELKTFVKFTLRGLIK